MLEEIGNSKSKDLDRSPIDSNVRRDNRKALKMKQTKKKFVSIRKMIEVDFERNVMILGYVQKRNNLFLNVRQLKIIQYLFR